MEDECSGDFWSRAELRMAGLSSARVAGNREKNAASGSRPHPRSRSCPAGTSAFATCAKPLAVLVSSVLGASHLVSPQGPFPDTESPSSTQREGDLRAREPQHIGGARSWAMHFRSPGVELTHAPLWPSTPPGFASFSKWLPNRRR